MLSPPQRAVALGAGGGVSSRAAVISHPPRAVIAAREEPTEDDAPCEFDPGSSEEFDVSLVYGAGESSARRAARLHALPFSLREPAGPAAAVAALSAAAKLQRLDALLRDLAADIQPGGAPALSTARLATGLPAVDRLLGGGFPRGRLAEIAGPLSSGRTSLALALLAETTRRGALVSVIDAADAFDPNSADAAGIDLARVLWARPPGISEALRCAEHVLNAGGFALVIVDLAFAAARERPHIPESAWPRLRKSAASTDAGLVLLTRERLAGASADLALEFAVARARFAAQPSWLEALESDMRLVRNRAGPTERAALVRFQPFAA